MAYRLTQTPTFGVKVEVLTKNEAGGTDKSTFLAKFHRSSTSDLDELRKLPQKEVLLKKLAGWEELLDNDDKPVEFNETTRMALLEVPEAILALVKAFWENVVVGREKN